MARTTPSRRSHWMGGVRERHEVSKAAWGPCLAYHNHNRPMPMPKKSISGPLKRAPKRRVVQVPTTLDLTHDASGRALSSPEELRQVMATWVPADLIGLAVTCQRWQQRAKMEESICLELLEQHFPCQKQEEEIITSKGVALRRVKNTYVINVDRISDLKRVLGAQFGEFVDEVTMGHVPEDRIAPLKETLGRDWPRFIVQKKGYKPTRLLSTRLSRGDDPADLVEGMVQVVSVPKVTVKPLDA